MILHAMGLTFVGGWQGPAGDHFNFRIDPQQPRAILGYEDLLPNQHFWQAETRVVAAGEARYSLSFRPDSCTLTVARLAAEPDTVRVKLAPLVRALVEEAGVVGSLENLAPERAASVDSSARTRVKVYMMAAQGTTKGGSHKVDQIDLEVLVGGRNAEPR